MASQLSTTKPTNEDDTPENCPKSGPGHKWITKLEELCMFHPSIFNREGDIKYTKGIIIALLLYAWYAGRFFLGSFRPDVGESLGNFFNVLGTAGQLMSFAAGMYTILFGYFRLRLLKLENITFIWEVVDYDDSKSNTVLSEFDGHFRQRMERNLATLVKLLKLASLSLNVNIQFTVLVVGIVSPLAIRGVSLSNIMFWTLSATTGFAASYFIAMDTVYIWGSWFICKTHMDLQVEFLISQMEELRKGNNNAMDIDQLYLRYQNLICRVKKFDNLSKDLISPYRFVVSYLGSLGFFAVHQVVKDNTSVILGIDSLVISLCATSFLFLLTACSLTIRRRRLYFLSNCVFVTMSRKRVPIHRQIILRRMVKSLGDHDISSICLSDTSGEEFEPMEFLEFVFDTFTNFSLIATLYYDYIK